MKKILLLFVGILISSCNHIKKNDSESKTNEKQTALTKPTENFDWLLGEWKRLNEEEGKETFENWKKISSTEYAGIGFTMQNGDTINQEKIKLSKINDKWNVAVKIPEEESVIFIGKSYNDNEFIVENTEIDFPNKIKYWKDGKKLKATIANSEMQILFEFEKINE